MREQVDEVSHFLHQFVELKLGSTFGEFIEVGILSASWHVVS